MARTADRSYDTTNMPSGFHIDWTASHEGPTLFRHEEDGSLSRIIYIGIECCDEEGCDHDPQEAARAVMGQDAWNSALFGL